MSDQPEQPKPQPEQQPPPAPAQTPPPAPQPDAPKREAQGRVHVIGPGEVVIDGRAGE